MRAILKEVKLEILVIVKIFILSSDKREELKCYEDYSKLLSIVRR
jgi:hypothetical protein